MGEPGDAPPWSADAAERHHHHHYHRQLSFGPDDREADGTLSATAAVNDAGNVWTTIWLEEGTYWLQDRWALQEGMVVIGADRDDTIVDGTDVPWSGLDDDYRALIGMGVANRVEGLTVRNSRLFAMIGNEPGDVGTPPFSATIRDVSVLGPNAPANDGARPPAPAAHSPMGLAFNGGDSPGETATVVIEDTLVDGILGSAGCEPQYYVLLPGYVPATCQVEQEPVDEATRGFGIFLGVGFGNGTLQASIRHSEATRSDINLITIVMASDDGGRIELDTRNNVFGGPWPSGAGVAVVAGGDPGTGAYPDPRVNEPMEGASDGQTEWTSKNDRFVSVPPIAFFDTLDHWTDAEETFCVYLVSDDPEAMLHPAPCVGSPDHAPHDLVGEEVEWVKPGSGPVRWNTVEATIRGPIFGEGPFDVLGAFGRSPRMDRCPGDVTNAGQGGCGNLVEAELVDPSRATATGLEPIQQLGFAGNCDWSQPGCHAVDTAGNVLSIDVVHRDHDEDCEHDDDQDWEHHDD